MNNLGEGAVEELKKMNQDLERIFEQKNITAYIRQNLKVHYRIWKECGNQFLFKSWPISGDKFFFYSNQIFAKIEDPEIFRKSIKEHVDLVKAIEKRDSASIERIVLSHWGGVGYL